MDFFISLLLLSIVLPIFILLYILVKSDSKGPFFFLQERLGYKGKVFKVYKVRTMTNEARIANREILKGDREVTRVGYWLRRFKLDELPQLINVLIGDMSLVGPRPGLPRQLEDFDENGQKRLLARPGLTGLAQVNGNIHLSWSERWRYDKQYVENLNFKSDLKILFKTALIVFLGEDKFIKKPNA
ncbi:MAG: sugar transferase [Ginsengibacter sp.]